MKQCKSCRYFDAYDTIVNAKIGLCLRYPPVFLHISEVLQEERENEKWGQPVVMGFDSCGEHDEK